MFGKVKTDRDFHLVIDCSEPMIRENANWKGKRITIWQQAQDIACEIAKALVKADEDGRLDVWLYSSSDKLVHRRITKGGLLNSPEKQMRKIFAEITPGGTSDLAGVIRAVGNQWAADSNGRPDGECKMTAVVLTSGYADSDEEVVDAIGEVAAKCWNGDQVAFSLNQLGENEDNGAFLGFLDDHKFEVQLRSGNKLPLDIVDANNAEKLAKRKGLVAALKNAIED